MNITKYVDDVWARFTDIVAPMIKHLDSLFKKPSKDFQKPTPEELLALMEQKYPSQWFQTPQGPWFGNPLLLWVLTNNVKDKDDFLKEIQKGIPDG